MMSSSWWHYCPECFRYLWPGNEPSQLSDCKKSRHPPIQLREHSKQGSHHGSSNLNDSSLSYFALPRSTSTQVMQSLAQEIKSFSKTNLRKQCTRVTTLSGRRIIETWKGSTVHVVEDTVQPETPCGYIQDNTWDLQVGCIRPYLLLGKAYSTQYHRCCITCFSFLRCAVYPV